MIKAIKNTKKKTKNSGALKTLEGTCPNDGTKRFHDYK